MEQKSFDRTKLPPRRGTGGFVLDWRGMVLCKSALTRRCRPTALRSYRCPARRLNDKIGRRTGEGSSASRCPSTPEAFGSITVRGREAKTGVARVIGEAKREAQPSGRVFVRGQTSHHEAMLPSLFRESTADRATLRAAEAALISKIQQEIQVARFRSPTIGALLQHYGFRTTWLDAVDNLFVACWFAGHNLSAENGGLFRARRSKDSFGWLFVLRPTVGSPVVDLRAEHHPLSARPHVQHGVSIPGDASDDPDLRRFVIATLRIPVEGLTGGRLLEASFLFPGASVDHTLRLLLKHRVDKLAAAVEKEHELACGTLGRTMRIADAA